MEAVARVNGLPGAGHRLGQEAIAFVNDRPHVYANGAVRHDSGLEASCKDALTQLIRSS
jgi:hypothetical protein